MRRGVRVLLVSALVLIAAAIGVVAAWPQLVRLALIAELRVATGRAVSVGPVTLDLSTGRLVVRDLQIANKDGTPFADAGLIDATVRRRSLLRGHLWVRDLTIRESTVRVVRLGRGDFNFSDLIQSGGSGGKSGGRFAVTVDRFLLDGGTVTLEDRVIAPPRTWRSENIHIEAKDVSTRHAGGTAFGTTKLDGSPVSVGVDQLRLEPGLIRAVVEAHNLDLSVARLYLPVDAPVTIDRGRLDTRVTILFDARAGTHVDVDGHVVDAAALRRRQRDPFVVAPDIRVTVRDLTFAESRFALGRFELTGAATVLHGDVSPPARFEFPRIRASVEGVTWPVTGPARLDVSALVPGGGELSARGSVGTEPRRADVRVTLSGLDLVPWARYFPETVHVRGKADATFDVTAALEGRPTATAVGRMGVNDVVVADQARRLIAAARAEATGVEVRWPARTEATRDDGGWPLAVAVQRVRVVRPAAVVERDADGTIDLAVLKRQRQKTGQSTADGDPPAPTTAPPARGPSIPITVSEIVMEQGALGWRDASVKPEARIDVASIDAAVRDVTWPLSGPLRVTARARPPGGGKVAATGNVSAAPIDAALHVTANGVDVAPYRPYVPLDVRLAGRADAAVDVELSRTPELHATVKGEAGLTRLVVADRDRTLLTVARGRASGVDVDWPSRVAVARVTLTRPSGFVERDEHGQLRIRSLLASARRRNAEPTAPDGAPAAANDDATSARMNVSVGRLAIEDGVVRLVDHSVSPAYTEDVSRLSVHADGLATAPAKPGRFEMRGMLGQTGVLDLRGQVGPFGGPVYVNLAGELRDFGVSRVNPYLRHHLAWIARNGRFSTRIECRVDGDTLDAKTNLHLAGLQLSRVARDDPAQSRIGIPLGMVVALMKNSRGDIDIALPVGGSLADPRFDLHEAIWGAVRAVALKTVALPVSWIGRLRLSHDSKIAAIDIDPATFDPGTVTMSRDGAAQVERIAGFMRRSAGARMVLTPVVTLGDIDRLKTEKLEKEIAKLASALHLTAEQAAQRLYAERFPGRQPPATVDEILTTLREDERPPADDALRLATRRVDAVRDELRQRGIDAARFEINRDAEALEANEGGRVEFAMTDQVRPHRGLLAELLHKLAEMFARRLARVSRQ